MNDPQNQETVTEAIAGAARKLNTPGAAIAEEAMRRFGLTKQQAITVALGVMVKEGIPANRALDLMFGEGTFKAIADVTWETIRKRKGLPV